MEDYTQVEQVELSSSQVSGRNILHYQTTDFQERTEDFTKQVETIAQIIDEDDDLNKKTVDIKTEDDSTRKEQNDNEIESKIISKKPSEKPIFDKIVENAKKFLEGKCLDSNLIRESEKEILDNALEIICKNFNSQTAAIFISSESDTLKRFTIYGLKKNGQLIENNEFYKHEAYKINDSFTGKAADPQNMGKGYLVRNLESINLYEESKKIYINELGNLGCAIAIPLNEKEKIYGVLRIINKIEEFIENKPVKLSQDPFSENDVQSLLIISDYISTALVNFRASIQNTISKDIARLMISHCSSNSLEGVLNKIGELLILNPAMLVKAVVFRAKNNKTGELEYLASPAAEGVTKTRNNEAKKDSDDGIIRKIITSGTYLPITDLQSPKVLKQFKNRDWIEENKFPCIISFPLIAKQDEIVGTVSFYMGDDPVLDHADDKVNFLKGIVDNLAQFILRVKQEELVGELQKSNDPSSIRALKDKNELQEIFAKLSKEWIIETATLPLINEKFMHSSYQKIIGIGPEIVPILLKEISVNPEYWFWALEAITHESPIKIEQRGRVKDMVNSWIQWGKEKSYWAEN
jgi:hypothetical protein